MANNMSKDKEEQKNKCRESTKQSEEVLIYFSTLLKLFKKYLFQYNYSFSERRRVRI